MAWKLHAIEQTQLRRQYRVDGVGRPEFDFHTGYGMLGEDASKEKWGDAADPDADPLVHASWGANYTKLQRIKAKYDPNNMFRLNHNVKPSAAPAAAASPTRPKPRRSLSGRVLSALSPGKKK